MYVREAVEDLERTRVLDRDRDLIPEGELRTVWLTFADALDMGGRGQVTAGQSLLIRGLQRAEIALLDQKPWAPALVTRWRDAIDRYCDRFSDSEE